LKRWEEEYLDYHGYLEPKAIKVPPLKALPGARLREKMKLRHEKRWEQAFWMRTEGLTYSAIGKKLGVSYTMAKILVIKYEMRVMNIPLEKFFDPKHETAPF